MHWQTRTHQTESKNKNKKKRTCHVRTPDLSLSGRGPPATQVHMTDPEQTRLVKIYHYHGRLKRPTFIQYFYVEMAHMLHLSKA